MGDKLASWQYLFDYEGQHPGYCELDDLPRPISVEIYGRNNKRRATSKATSEVEFEYEYAPGAVELLRKQKQKGMTNNEL